MSVFAAFLAYNVGVPTPFYHLSIAIELLETPALPESIHAFLEQQQSAFFLGKTAPDVQTLSGQSRPETHFYRVPIVSPVPPWERMFKKYADLGRFVDQPPAQRAFMAGYICHLQADLIWIKDLFVSYFLPRITKATRKRIGYLHNVLRAYLDERILDVMPDDVGDKLTTVRPDGWLPFVEDAYLVEWRDYIAGQLMPGAQPQTIEVFAKRLDISPDAFVGMLHSEARMEAELFSFLPRQVLVEYRQKIVAANVELLIEYLAEATALGE